MREILFRGKRVDNGEWVYGFYGHKPNGNEVEEHFIMEWCFNAASDSIYTYFRDVPVIPETVGQYSGLDDKNGVKIFEGGILRDDEYIVIVKFFIDGRFRVDYRTMGGKWVNYGDLLDYLYRYKGKVVGNVHDNPELVVVVVSE